MKRLTVGKLRKLGEKYPYLMLRYKNGFSFAVNTKVFSMGENAKYDADDYCPFISFRPIDFMEYISRKPKFK